MKLRALGLAIALSMALPGMGAMAQNVTPTKVTFSNAKGVKLQGFLFKPSGGSTARRPAVVMMHGCSGVYSYSNPATGKLQNIYHDWGNRLTKAGYVALLVDSFTARGTQNECNNGANVGVSEVYDRPLDAEAGYRWLATTRHGVDPKRIALLGWSHGGSSVVATLAKTAADGTTSNRITKSQMFRGGVAFYPGCGLGGAFGGTTNSNWSPAVPLTIFHGTHDKLYDTTYIADTDSMSAVGSGNTTLRYPCETRVDRAVSLYGSDAGSKAPAVIRVFQGAHHSFDVPGQSCTSQETTPDACAKATADAEAMQLLNKVVGK